MAVEQNGFCDPELHERNRQTVPQYSGTMRRVYQVNMVRPLFVLPQPERQSKASTHFPARPQSEALMTVVGQNPQRPFAVSTRQSKPGSAVRMIVGFPFS